MDATPDGGVPRSGRLRIAASLAGRHGVEAVPVEWTVQAFENAGVDAALLSAWWGSEGPLLILPAVIT